MEQSQHVEFYTVQEIAEILKVSPMTVVRRMGDLPGVIDLGTEERMHKRRYRLLRIPRAVLHKFLQGRAA